VCSRSRNEETGLGTKQLADPESGADPGPDADREDPSRQPPRRVPIDGSVRAMDDG